MSLRLMRTHVTSVTILKRLREEDGYTLLETLVAMALFLSVLIPLGVAIGNLTLGDSAATLNVTLQIAQSEMSRALLRHDFHDERKQDERGFLIERKVERKGNIVDLSVSIFSLKHPGKKVLVLSKSFLDYQ